MSNKNGGGMPPEIRTVLMWGLGIGILAMTLLILSVIFGNLSGNTGLPDSTTNISVTNESDDSLAQLVYVNTTTYTLNGFNSSWSSIAVETILADANQSNGSQTGITKLPSGYTLTVPSANFTLSSSGVLENATTFVYPNVTLTYSYIYTFAGQIKRDTESIITNYTASALNTSKQFPVTGTILGIALLLAILIGILVFAIRKMMGVAGSSGAGGSNSSSGGSFDRGGFG